MWFFCTPCFADYAASDLRAVCPDCLERVEDWLPLSMDTGQERIDTYLLPVDTDAVVPLSDDDADTNAGDEKQDYYFEDVNDMGDF